MSCLYLSVSCVVLFSTYLVRVSNFVSTRLVPGPVVTWHTYNAPYNVFFYLSESWTVLFSVFLPPVTNLNSSVYPQLVPGPVVSWYTYIVL